MISSSETWLRVARSNKFCHSKAFSYALIALIGFSASMKTGGVISLRWSTVNRFPHQRLRFWKICVRKASPHKCQEEPMSDVKWAKNRQYLKINAVPYVYLSLSKSTMQACRAGAARYTISLPRSDRILIERISHAKAEWKSWKHQPSKDFEVRFHGVLDDGRSCIFENTCPKCLTRVEMVNTPVGPKC